MTTNDKKCTSTQMVRTIEQDVNTWWEPRNPQHNRNQNDNVYKNQINPPIKYLNRRSQS